MGNKIQTRDTKHSKTTAWEIDCNSLTLEEALKILNPNNYSIYRMAEKRGAYKRVVMELDNANPSEALKSFETLEIHNKYDNCWQIFSTDIKQALIQATQDKKKATCWDIVVKKSVDMLLIKKYDNVSDYNSAVWLSGREKLIEEEFKLLKECLE